ncbi:MAG: hypothetical protein GY859_12255, partial [Desulfobacterales bacterium]|nr:hypothetical protein [Desulfobacterales bacterium]
MLRPGPAVALLSLLFFLFFPAACAVAPNASPPGSPGSGEPAPGSLEYVLGDGDLLNLTFFHEPAAVLEEYRVHVGDGLSVSFAYYPDLDS